MPIFIFQVEILRGILDPIRNAGAGHFVWWARKTLSPTRSLVFPKMCALFRPPPIRVQRRVVVTGLGVVSPLGINLETVWSRLLRGDCGVVSVRSSLSSSLRQCSFTYYCGNCEHADKRIWIFRRYSIKSCCSRSHKRLKR